LKHFTEIGNGKASHQNQDEYALNMHASGTAIGSQEHKAGWLAKISHFPSVPGPKSQCIPAKDTSLYTKLKGKSVVVKINTTLARISIPKVRLFVLSLGSPSISFNLAPRQ
jgi:hypothetical protein